MNDDSVTPASDLPAEQAETGLPAEPATAGLPMVAGAAMPGVDPQRLPRLEPGLQALASASDASGPGVTRIAEGMSFTGNAELRGPCSISGRVEGHLRQAPGSQVAVVVTETGEVKGDILASKISVMGRTDGTLDAGGGSVSLHDASSVSGHVRYARIQVNGADLNATLERVSERRDDTP